MADIYIDSDVDTKLQDELAGREHHARHARYEPGMISSPYGNQMLYAVVTARGILQCSAQAILHSRHPANE